MFRPGFRDISPFPPVDPWGKARRSKRAIVFIIYDMESRIQFTLEFPDYTREELGAIAQRFLTSKQYSISDDALIRFLDIMEYFRKQPNFANARTVRNVIDQVIMNQNLRTEDNENDSLIILEDVEDYLADEGIDIHGSRQGTRRIGFV